ncbi:MAG: D-alanyl-D-alanine carboxypeptidase [Desulfitobacteriaceae bacterium]|nr:D-alanyl-D-alanine carboxypeptidase [Desulfitobacteriaceae bacterium]MDD4753496.1 D-alanyl-D-alanine carboxypeptidase [Desulfitobacteriaceae bacterium]
MKKIINMLIIIVFMFSLFPAAVFADPEINAKSAILIEAETGRVLFEKKSHEQLPIASTTKITTALITLEREKNLQKKVRVPADFINPGEAGIWLEPGERHTLEDLLYALLLRSANDAAAVIAAAVGGSEADFIQLMNDKVRELGLKDTHYVNPHGLHDEDHYSSAYDLAMITREALTYEEFRKVIMTDRHILPWPGHEYSRVVHNRNNLLDTFDGADGVKTGYTSQAGSCLVGSATRNGMQLIAVVLHSDGMYDDTAKLLEYGFKNYEAQQLISKGKVFGKVPVEFGKTSEVRAVAARGLSTAMRKTERDQVEQRIDLPAKVQAPIEKGQNLGTVTVKIGTDTFMRVDLVAGESVKNGSFLAALWETVQSVVQFFMA